MPSLPSARTAATGEGTTPSLRAIWSMIHPSSRQPSGGSTSRSVHTAYGVIMCPEVNHGYWSRSSPVTPGNT